MVAIRSAYLTSIDKFTADRWVASLKLINNESEQKLISLWYYCYNKVQQNKNYQLLFWRGIEMGEILSVLNIDLDILCAAILFPLVSAKIITEDIINVEFGNSIYALVKGAMEINTLYKSNDNKFNEGSFIQASNIRQILHLSMTKDFRCIIIKIAERIIYLRETKWRAKSERILIAKECLNIYAPLANRLRIWKLNWELEDFCFYYLHPSKYKRIAKLLNERRIDREKYIHDFILLLQHHMLAGNITAEIYGRPKHIYSIWQKMQKKQLAFDELFDVYAVRIIVECLSDCRIALEIVHANFYYLSDKFDDYIANPKPNGYQSIHTVVLGPNNKAIEIQIRTKKMHHEAELGVAAHWKYKEVVAIITLGIIVMKFFLSS